MEHVHDRPHYADGITIHLPAIESLLGAFSTTAIQACAVGLPFVAKHSAEVLKCFLGLGS